MIDEPSWPLSEDVIELKCAHCRKPVSAGREISCVCAKYGIVGHEESAWCSDDCMYEDHPDEGYDEDV